jgi:hypothetical protein
MACRPISQESGTMNILSYHAWDLVALYGAVYAASVIGGFLVVGACLWVVWQAVGEWNALRGKYEPFAPLDFFVGGTERCVATTLVLLAPNYLAPFIGGWIALKFAANWKRQGGQ